LVAAAVRSNTEGPDSSPPEAGIRDLLAADLLAADMPIALPPYRPKPVPLSKLLPSANSYPLPPNVVGDICLN
jgi:hypothetical protein